MTESTRSTTDGSGSGNDKRRFGPGALPSDFAFVVQFGSATAATEAQFCGRIEHIVSGRQRRFNDADDLLLALRDMLAGVRDAD